MKLSEIQDYTINTALPLLPEQQEGVRFLVTRTKGILAFQTGLGKTLVSCTALTHTMRVRSDIRGIITCPVNALSAFEKELKGLGYKDKDIGWLCTQKMDYDVNTNKVFIFSYPTLDTNYTLIKELRKKFILIGIMDEAHLLQADDTGQKKILEEIKESLNVIWLATATPLLNDLLGFYNVVTFLDPNFFGTKTAFINRYLEFKLKPIYIKGGKKKMVRDYTGTKNLEELKKRVEPICIMRQRKYDLTFGYFCEELSDEEQSIYERVGAGIMTDEEQTFSARMHDLQRVVDNCYENELISKYDSTKERLLFKVLTKVMEKGFPIILYCDYKDTVLRLEEILKQNQRELNFNKIYKITGEVSKQERDYIKDNIVSRDIIIITSAGSTSINLQRSNCILFYDIPFSVGIALQAIGRITRVDTKHAKQYVMVMYTKGTIDEYKYLLFLDHAKVIQQVLGSDANLPVGNLKEMDKKNMDAIKAKLLWHYKDGNKKIQKRNKKLLDQNLIVCKSSDYMMEMGEYKINLCPRGIEPTGTKRIEQIMPENGAYNALIKDPNFFSIFRNKYIDVLKSDNGKKVLNMIVDSAVNQNKAIIFVDDYGVGKIIRDYIIENAKI